MKRYWKLILLVSFIVLVIGAFYIQTSTATSRLPEFVFETVSGDEKEIEKLTLEASFIQEGIGDSFQLNADGTTYWGEYTYFERMLGVNQSPKMERLQKDYRGFMRGKSMTPYHFYEDENLLVYVNLTWDTMNGYQPNDFELDIGILDKVSKEETSFQAPIPVNKNSMIYSMDVEGIHIIDGQLKVISRNYSYDKQSEKDITAYQVYLVDIAAETIQSEAIITAKEDEVSSNQYREIRIVDNKWEDIQQPMEQVVFGEELIEESVIDEWESTYETIDRELFHYNLVTGEKEQIKLPKGISNNAFPYTANDEMIYFTEDVEGKLEITSFNMENGKIEAKQTIAIPEVTDELGYMYKIYGEKVYVVPASKLPKQDLSLYIIHLRTGDTLYEGKITMKNPKKQDIDYDLDIHSIELDE
ncbi:hypothetical protein NSQ77_07590 [Oceanobacillus sp. FSL K6-2867]|uniref:hypothetical protein n=1 Tax=Oceanobacillus sp. FSL K6-2867 TaxID=2954748 RepID=UPI0030DC0060